MLNDKLEKTTPNASGLKVAVKDFSDFAKSDARSTEDRCIALEKCSTEKKILWGKLCEIGEDDDNLLESAKEKDEFKEIVADVVNLKIKLKNLDTKGTLLCMIVLSEPNEQEENGEA